MTKVFESSTLFDVVMDKGGFDSILASGSVATAEKTSGQIDALLKPNGHRMHLRADPETNLGRDFSPWCSKTLISFRADGTWTYTQHR